MTMIFSATPKALASSLWIAGLLTMGLAACGKQDAPAPSVASPAASAPAAADKAVAKKEEKDEGHNPMEHEGIPGMTDMFSKKKE